MAAMITITLSPASMRRLERLPTKPNRALLAAARRYAKELRAGRIIPPRSRAVR